jgi:hypothetical protein
VQSLFDPTNQATIINLFRVINRYVGNLATTVTRPRCLA